MCAFGQKKISTIFFTKYHFEAILQLNSMTFKFTVGLAENCLCLILAKPNNNFI